MKQINIGKVGIISFVKKITELMVVGKLDNERSDFTIIYGDFTPEYINAFKEQIEKNVSKIPRCSTDSTTGLHRNYFWVKREDGSTGCIKMYGKGRMKGVRWEDKRPSMAITAVKAGTSKCIDEEIFAGVLLTLTPQNPVWVEVEIDDAKE